MEITPVSSRRSSESSVGSSPRTRSAPPPPLDFSQLPPLSQPAPATNTLLFTNLIDLEIFRAENLDTIRHLIEQTAPIHTWAPLRSFRRIVVAFRDEPSATHVRSIWDGEAIMGERVRVYYGAPTQVEARDEHLALPDAGKLFFISPPPSPPSDWEMRLEDVPNKLVHADDLAEALARLQKKRNNSVPLDSPVYPLDSAHTRARSGSTTLIYMPEEHADGPHLPSIAVEDMTDEAPEDSPVHSPRIMSHTARPPVELMQC